MQEAGRLGRPCFHLPAVEPAAGGCPRMHSAHCSRLRASCLRHCRAPLGSRAASGSVSLSAEPQQQLPLVRVQQPWLHHLLPCSTQSLRLPVEASVLAVTDSQPPAVRRFAPLPLRHESMTLLRIRNRRWKRCLLCCRSMPPLIALEHPHRLQARGLRCCLRRCRHLRLRREQCAMMVLQAQLVGGRPSYLCRRPLVHRRPLQAGDPALKYPNRPLEHSGGLHR